VERLMNFKNWRYVFSNDDLFEERKSNFKYYFVFEDYGPKKMIAYGPGQTHSFNEVESWCEEFFDEKFLLGVRDLCCDSEEDFVKLRLKWL
jgi:hypothetical protein